MELEEIKLETETSKTKAILDNLGKEVLLKDSHWGWHHGHLLEDNNHNRYSSYRISLAHTLGDLVKVLNYHDLQTLILLE